jgi:hypothetical protein
MSSDKESLRQRCLNILDGFFLGKDRVMPCCFSIPDDHVVGKDYSPSLIQRDKHYFIVEINEMYLVKQSKLWVNFDPTVYVTTGFKYAGNEVTVPFVVGPSMMEKYKQPGVENMIFCNTKVAGYYPYKGGDLSLSVILCRAATDSHAKDILKLVEEASGALDYSTAVNSYLKLANVIVDGIESLNKLKGINGVVGLRTEFRETKHDLRQRYYVLINMPEKSPEVKNLYVVDDKLYKDKDAKVPFREADYVLYSIRISKTRDTDCGLAFDPLWERVKEESMMPGDESWKKATADMMSLFQTMYLSPDLTTTHALVLKADHEQEMLSIHPKPLAQPSLTATLSEPPKRELSELAKELSEDKNLRDAVKILDLGK